MKAEEAQLHAMAETAGPGGPEIVRLLDEGDPVANILERIRAQAIDLLVMGTHGHKGFNRLVLGSITEQIIHQAPCPVLTVSRPRRCGFVASNSTEYPPPRTILLATDFSGCSDRALAYGLRWASEWGGRVVLFHTVETEPAILQGRVDLFPEYNPAFEQQIARAWGLIGRLVPESTGAGCEVSYEIRHGSPRAEILRVASEKGADLIVMGARGISEGEHAWGSNSSAVVRAAKFPVLVVREEPG
jgi:nucleotide-binding universal stress UspA family protein